MTAAAARVEVMIERWTIAGATDYRWSVWRDGKRLAMGGPHPSFEASEADARAACRKALGREPDRVTRL